MRKYIVAVVLSFLFALVLYAQDAPEPKFIQYGDLFQEIHQIQLSTSQDTTEATHQEAWYFEGETGDMIDITYDVRNSASGIYVPPDGIQSMLLQIRDQDGSLLRTNATSNRAEAKISINDFVIPSDGIYFIVVGFYGNEFFSSNFGRVAVLRTTIQLYNNNGAKATLAPPPTAMPDMSAEAQIARDFNGSQNSDWQPIEAEFNEVAMVLVPVGSFEMGSDQEEIDYALETCQEAVLDDTVCEARWFEREESAHTQTITQPFWIDKYEVSRQQYQECVDAGECLDAGNSDFSSEPDQPINRVDWSNALAYCRWRGGSLPTEVQWEYAASGIENFRFPWGNDFDEERANHCDSQCHAADWAAEFNFANIENNDGHAITAPVDSYPEGVSWVGAYNMAGNVSEWTTSKFETYPYDSEDGRENLVVPFMQDNYRVIRGGSFYVVSLQSRTTYRNASARTSLTLGLRCVRPQY